MKLTKVASVVSLAVLFAVPTFATDAHAQACGMGVDIDWYQTERAAVSRADDLLRDGESKKAAYVLQQMWPRIREAKPVEGSVSVITDGVRLMALAAVRSDGDVRSGLGWSSRTLQERASNVAWGVKELRTLAKLYPFPQSQTDLGEALSRSENTREEARAILEKLDAVHEIASQEGYAALALVRRELGDAPAVTAAR